MNILITDYYCASNRGDAAILEGAYQSLKEVYPDSDITVMTENPKAAKFVNGIDAEKQILAGFQWTVSKKNAARTYLSLTSQLYTHEIPIPGFEYIKKQANLEPYLNADLVISTGGQFLTDIYFPEKVGILWEHFYLSQLDTPVVIYAQTLGPFERSPYRQITRAVLNEIDLIITRDEKSKQLVEDMGVSTPIRFTADAAFSMEVGGNKETLLDCLKSNDALPEEQTVSISIREWSGSNENIAVEDYAQDVADVADWLIFEQNMNVVFASTCTSLGGYHIDDRLMAAKVVDMMEHGESDNVQIISGEYTPQQLVDIYDKMELHIGMRMHSNVLAMLAETPVVAIQYQFKTEGLMKMFDLKDYMIDITEVTSDSLRNIVEKALNQRIIIEDSISSELETVEERSHRSAQLVRQHIG